MEAIIDRFNSLPRKERSPSGMVANHWHFSIRQVPLEPPGELLFLTNPASHFVHTEGPLPPPNSSDSEETRAVAIAFLLVKAFASGLGGSAPEGRTSETLSVGRPWSWSTTTNAKAREMETALRTLGVTEELLHVETASEETNKGADEDWDDLFQKLSSFVSGRPVPGV
ncbi:MAG: hypothetical protein Q9227_000434 [Pyrenula ochraceoflavens]